jgi:predicted TIM-barrel enzyme
MGLVVAAVAAATGPKFQVGVQLMRNALRASLAVAKVAGGGYIRAGALVGATLTPSGLVQADPLGVMEYRNKINARDVKIIAEVDSMHFQWLGGSKPVGEVARAAVRAGADAVSLSHPDDDTTLEMIAAVREAVPDVPVCSPAGPITTTRRGCWRRRTARSSGPAWRPAAGAAGSMLRRSRRMWISCAASNAERRPTDDDDLVAYGRDSWSSFVPR